MKRFDTMRVSLTEKPSNRRFSGHRWTGGSEDEDEKRLKGENKKSAKIHDVNASVQGYMIGP